MGKVKPVWILPVLLAAAGAALYFSEWVEKTQDIGFSEKALRNRYLAAERFLDSFGITVKLVDGLLVLDNLPPVDEAILLAGSRRSLSKRRIRELLGWVEAGGRLIVVATDIWDSETQASGDGLLDPLGIQVHRNILDEEDSAEQIIKQLLPDFLGAETCESSGGHTRVEFADEQQAIAVNLHPANSLYYEGDHNAYAASSDVGPQLLYVDVGTGSLVVLTTATLWRNSRIGCVDHAHLLRWLTEDRAVLWWLFNTQMEALPVLLWKKWPLAIFSGVLLFALWCWRGMLRTGRIQASGTGVRRQLMEHIEGSARFRWQQRDAEGLLESMRRSVLAGASISDSSDPHLRVLAQLSGVSVKDAQMALFGNVDGDINAFTTAIQTLQKLRQSSLLKPSTRNQISG